MMKKSIAVGISSSALLFSLLTASVAFAESPKNTPAPIARGHMGVERGHGMKDKMNEGHASSTMTIPTGNGQPVVGGTVTAVGSSTITITNKSNATYTVTTSGAAVTRAGAPATLSQVVVGDRLLIQGSVNGSSITASTIMDMGTTPTNNNSSEKPRGFMGKMMGGMSGMFQHLFGFF